MKYRIDYLFDGRFLTIVEATCAREAKEKFYRSIGEEGRRILDTELPRSIAAYALIDEDITEAK